MVQLERGLRHVIHNCLGERRSWSGGSPGGITQHVLGRVQIINKFIRDERHGRMDGVSFCCSSMLFKCLQSFFGGKKKERTRDTKKGRKNEQEEKCKRERKERKKNRERQRLPVFFRDSFCVVCVTDKRPPVFALSGHGSAHCD